MLKNSFQTIGNQIFHSQLAKVEKSGLLMKVKKQETALGLIQKDLSLLL